MPCFGPKLDSMRLSALTPGQENLENSLEWSSSFLASDWKRCSFALMPVLAHVACFEPASGDSKHFFLPKATAFFEAQSMWRLTSNVWSLEHLRTFLVGLLHSFVHWQANQRLFAARNAKWQPNSRDSLSNSFQMVKLCRSNHDLICKA